MNIPLIYPTAINIDKKSSMINDGYGFCSDGAKSFKPLLTQAQHIIHQHKLPIALSLHEHASSKLTQKIKRQISQDYARPVLIIDEKLTLSLLINGISVCPDWAGLQKRVVSAGRKSELLLQAAKLNAEHTVLDATAGFGQDSLILAATGAKVTMLEREPLLALLLLLEQQKMAQLPNWQKLMARLTIIYTSAEAYLQHLHETGKAAKFDVTYLDPMFPENSYHDSKKGRGAKVGKHMQALHGLVTAPTLADETSLFKWAKQSVVNSGRLIVKRPVNAPPLAQQPPDEQWQNDVLRFDGYFLAN